MIADFFSLNEKTSQNRERQRPAQRTTKAGRYRSRFRYIVKKNGVKPRGLTPK